MTVSHHPTEDLLLSYASGSLDEANSILIATHLALCPSCRSIVNTAEALGGEFLEDIDPIELDEKAFDRAFDRAFDQVSEGLDDYRPDAVFNHNSSAFGDVLLPKPLNDYIPKGKGNIKWRWLGPGLRYLSLNASSKTAKVGLLKISPGTKVPHHGHSGNEMTMVLSGAYADGVDKFSRGDVEHADPSLIHQPIAEQGEDCICLVVTEGNLLPTGMLASVVSRFSSF